MPKKGQFFGIRPARVTQKFKLRNSISKDKGPCKPEELERLFTKLKPADIKKMGAYSIADPAVIKIFKEVQYLALILSMSGKTLTQNFKLTANQLGQISLVGIHFGFTTAHQRVLQEVRNGIITDSDETCLAQLKEKLLERA